MENIMRLARVNQVYFAYPVSLSLNDESFLVALLEKSKQISQIALYSVDKKEGKYVFCRN